jgi:hypothetical protein
MAHTSPLETVESPRPRAKLIHQLVALAPEELGPLYRTHLEDNFGELLPHLMMADITRWLASLVGRTEDDEHPAPADLELLHTVVAFLEEQFASGDEATRELIAVSFLENLWQTGDQYAAINNLLGPSLRSSLDQMDT